MSGKPSSEGAAKVIEIIQKMLELNEEETELKEYVVRLRQVTEEKKQLDRDLKRLLESMDVETPGNFGWSGRFAWLLAAVVDQMSEEEEEEEIVCANCGGSNVQVVAWLDPNTEEAGEYFGSWDETDTKYCADCDQHVLLIDKEDFSHGG